jgi:hypothetical protein
MTQYSGSKPTTQNASDIHLAGIENQKFLALVRKSKKRSLACTASSLAVLGQAIVAEDAKVISKVPEAKQESVNELAYKFSDLIADVDESIVILALDEFIQTFIITDGE